MIPRAYSFPKARKANFATEPALMPSGAFTPSNSTKAHWKWQEMRAALAHAERGNFSVA
jgi:hypothetical protein